jgi:polysaccharide transporter, PST family
LIGRLDVFIISLMSATVAGLFAAGERTLAVLALLPALAATTLYPHLAKDADPIHGAWRAGLMFGLIAMPIAALVAILAPTLVPALFGDQYVEAVDGLQVLMIGLPLVFVASVARAGVYSVGGERPLVMVMLLSTIVGTCVVIAGYLLLGLVGACAGFVVRWALINLGVAALSIRLRRGSRDKPDEAI